MGEIKRKTNIDFLKIILGIMVIANHYLALVGKGGLSDLERWSTNYIIAHIIESICIIAVNTYIIITGYFSYKKIGIKISKPIKLYAITIFYGIVISLFVILYKKPTISFGYLLQVYNAIFNRWFVVIYCILYLLIQILIN